MFPTFLVVGAAKSGTTSLYHYLNQHPKIYMSPIKEPYYFSFIGKKPAFTGPYDEKLNKERIITTRSAYERLFAGATTEKALGECSNSYLYFPESAINIKAAIPECRIIIILRNPIERAFSHYRQVYSFGHESLSFEDALEQQAERRRNNWRWHYQYVDQGMYYRQVRNFYHHFKSDYIHVALIDDLQRNPAAFMQGVYAFLGVDDQFMPSFEKHNVTLRTRSVVLRRLTHERNALRTVLRRILPKFWREKIASAVNLMNYRKTEQVEMLPETRQRLREIFREDIELLAAYIGRDLSHWLE